MGTLLPECDTSRVLGRQSGTVHEHIAHFVMLDEAFYGAFHTADSAKAEEATNMLIEAFGHDRVSGWSVVESDLDSWRTTIAGWKADPRIRDQRE